MSDIYIIKLTERQTKKDILAHNKAWQANCLGQGDLILQDVNSKL